MHSLENDRNVVTKPADKGSSIIVWDRLDYLEEVEKQLSDCNTYREVKLLKKDQVKLVKKAPVFLKSLKIKQLLGKKRKITLKLILKRSLTLVSYVYPRYIRGLVTCQQLPFQNS